MSIFNLFKNDPNVELFKAGTVIFKENEPGYVMYIIQEGKVDISLNGKLLETVAESEPLGEMAMLDPGASRSVTAIANQDCKLVPIDQKRFTFLVQENPYFSIEIMKVLARRLKLMDLKVEQNLT
jgi:CRP/FNR family transcriptional regulator, cyclic AMP receptor protein